MLTFSLHRSRRSSGLLLLELFHFLVAQVVNRLVNVVIVVVQRVLDLFPSCGHGWLPRPQLVQHFRSAFLEIFQFFRILRVVSIIIVVVIVVANVLYPVSRHDELGKWTIAG
jgi:uncharacterized membrane protein